MNDLSQTYIPPGAGIIVVKNFPTGLKVLGLFDQNKGKFDLPKGIIDLGESAFQAALRETEEECGITRLNFKWGKIPLLTVSHLTLFIAETDQDPAIMENPTSGILEHLFAEWLDWDDFEASVIDYLVPAIKKARNITERW